MNPRFPRKQSQQIAELEARLMKSETDRERMLSVLKAVRPYLPQQTSFPLITKTELSGIVTQIDEILGEL